MIFNTLAYIDTGKHQARTILLSRKRHATTIYSKWRIYMFQMQVCMETQKPILSQEDPWIQPGKSLVQKMPFDRRDRMHWRMRHHFQVQFDHRKAPNAMWLMSNERRKAVPILGEKNVIQKETRSQIQNRYDVWSVRIWLHQMQGSSFSPAPILFEIDS